MTMSSPKHNGTGETLQTGQTRRGDRKRGPALWPNDSNGHRNMQFSFAIEAPSTRRQTGLFLLRHIHEHKDHEQRAEGTLEKGLPFVVELTKYSRPSGDR